MLGTVAKMLYVLHEIIILINAIFNKRKPSWVVSNNIFWLPVNLQGYIKNIFREGCIMCVIMDWRNYECDKRL